MRTCSRRETSPPGITVWIKRRICLGWSDFNLQNRRCARREEGELFSNGRTVFSKKELNGRSEKIWKMKGGVFAWNKIGVPSMNQTFSNANTFRNTLKYV
ncbi:hypothetical protein NPIL_526111 [Nephila pilipes]|uniref:Uncharacterized protein n=1 Tax=Nephila pilipes TaxID=299642 RepID=A0A8X6U9N1_NEPPI|nr:hypothetical protein NPIL_526111 [Nephila pilipes]